jgi:GH24 family phage-related lysozyme (muramidase)
MTVDVKQVYSEIAEDEGKVLHKYLCSEGHPTIGIGHKVLPELDAEEVLSIYGVYDKDVPKEQKISEGRCYELFQEDVQVALGGCQKIYSNWEELPQEMQHVLINMCFQLGQGGLSKFKNFKSAVEDKNWTLAAVEMMDSRWASQTPERAIRLSKRVVELESLPD